MQSWEYLTVYVSGILDFPDVVTRAEMWAWAGKAIGQQINEYAAQGWQVLDMHWLSDREVMVTFKRPAYEDRPDDYPGA